MPDIHYLLAKWWKHLLSIILLSMAGVFIILYLRPSKYLSIATALPSSSYASDKGSIFNQNIQSLYQSLGTPDDLDVIVGTAQLDTVYLALVEKYDLVTHYEVQRETTRLKAALMLKANTQVIKSEYSELKVKVWDKDKNFAALFANAIIEKLQEIHRDLQNSSNIALLTTLQSGKQKIQKQSDSIHNLLNPGDSKQANGANYTELLASLARQSEQFEKLIGEYQFIVDGKPPVLIIVEKARPANKPDKPDRTLILIATFVLSLLFGLGVILLLERRKASTGEYNGKA